MRKPKREIHVPHVSRFTLAIRAVAPKASEKLVVRILNRYHITDQPAPRTEGNLYQGAREWNRVHGDWPPLRVYSRRKLIAATADVGAAALVAETLRRRAA